MKSWIIGFFMVTFSTTLYAQALFPLWQKVRGFKALTAGQEQLVTLWKDEQTAKKVGTIILLPDWSTVPSMGDTINTLHQKLPQWGWQTITMVPPFPKQRDQLLTNDDPKVLERYQQQLVASLESLEKARSEQFGYQVIIAQGVMAEWMLRIYSQQQRPLPDALIIIDGYFPNMALNQTISTQLPAIQRPIFDLYFQDANDWAQPTVDARRIAMQRAQRANYRQSYIPSLSYLTSSNELAAKQIYGWFSSLGWQ